MTIRFDPHNPWEGEEGGEEEGEEGGEEEGEEGGEEEGDVCVSNSAQPHSHTATRSTHNECLSSLFLLSFFSPPLLPLPRRKHYCETTVYCRPP